jgi:hypothetical protein
LTSIAVSINLKGGVLGVFWTGPLTFEPITGGSWGSIMRNSSFRLALAIAFFITLFAVTRESSAVSFYDNFNDGSFADGTPETWDKDLFGFFPGIYDASSGDYQMSSPGGTDGDQLVTWVDNKTFGNSYIRTQGTVLPSPTPEPGGNLAILGRLDTSTVSAYVMYLDVGGNLALQISLGGALSDLTPSVQTSFNASAEVVLELNIIGDQLSGYAWLAGTPKPSAPLITATDNFFASGKAGIAYGEDDEGTIGVFRFAAAQDTPFSACDFDLNSRCDIADMDALAMAASAGGNNLLYDLTGDGAVNGADVDAWRSQAGDLNIGAGRPYRVGDANLDGVVDGTDFGLWNANKFTATGKWSQGDFNVDGNSDGSDFGLWNANKFTSSDGSLVPEPSSLGLLLAGSLLLMRRRS